MNRSPFERLDFDRRQLLHLSRRAAWVIVVVLGYLLGWWLLPGPILFWLGLPLVTGLAWAASYSRREVVSAAMSLLRRLDSL